MSRKLSVITVGFMIAMSSGNVTAEVLCNQAPAAAPSRAADNGGAWQRNGVGNGIQPVVKVDTVSMSGAAWRQNSQGNSITAQGSAPQVSLWVRNNAGSGIVPCNTTDLVR